MSWTRRLVAILAAMFGAAALLASSVQPGAPRPARTEGSLAFRDGQEITFTTPQFKVEALWFKANDETGWYWTGSDEVYAVFSDMDPAHIDRTTSIYEDVDEGDTVNFKAADTCMAPQSKCDRGLAELNVRFAFWESDWAAPLYFSVCLDDYEGSHWHLDEGICIDDDFIGRGSIIYSREELVAMLPNVGDSREFTAVMDKDAGKYRFRYRITRVANAERSIVIHLPPDILTPTITLQTEVVTVFTGKAVRLTWSGATTSTVDIYRDGAKILTTANDGTQDDPVAAGTYQYKVCDLGSTTACSAQVQVTVA